MSYHVRVSACVSSSATALFTLPARARNEGKRSGNYPSPARNGPDLLTKRPAISSRSPASSASPMNINWQSRIFDHEALGIPLTRGSVRPHVTLYATQRRCTYTSARSKPRFSDSTILRGILFTTMPRRPSWQRRGRALAPLSWLKWGRVPLPSGHKHNKTRKG